MTAPSAAPDPEKADLEKLKEIQAIAKKLAAPFTEIAAANLKDPQAVSELDKLVSRLPDAAAVTASVTALKSDALAAIRSIRDIRKKRFGRVLSEFIQAQRAAGIETREVGEAAWRVGRLEIEGDSAASRARAKYAKNEVMGWRAVATSADLGKLVEEANAALVSSEINEADLGPIFQDAYSYLSRSGQAGNQASRRVSLFDLRVEVHLAVLRKKLQTPDGEKKLAKSSFPAWAFAYNADRYRRIHHDLPAAQKLSFETGSQQDIKNGRNVVMNGLDAKQDLKSYCYVNLTPGEASA